MSRTHILPILGLRPLLGEIFVVSLIFNPDEIEVWAVGKVMN